jgi:PadR family transcriptional regulator, regulatory protein PadR
MRKMTLTALEIVAVLMDAPDGEVYGLQVMQGAGLNSGSVYPALAGMERAGWLTARQECIDPHIEQRPSRRYYRLTAAGAAAAETAMARLPKFHAAGTAA